MKTVTAICATLMGAMLLAGGPASADDRFSRSELERIRAYEEGYQDALRRRGSLRRQEVAPPPSIALDGKEGYSQSYQVHRQYLDRDRDYDRRDYDRRGYDRRRYDRDDDWGYTRRHYDRDDYYERRLRRSDSDQVIDFATDILRGALSN